jgi:hypothetical protein
MCVYVNIYVHIYIYILIYSYLHKLNAFIYMYIYYVNKYIYILVYVYTFSEVKVSFTLSAVSCKEFFFAFFEEIAALIEPLISDYKATCSFNLFLKSE